MTHALVRQVRAALAERADPVRAVGMQRYMKSAMPYRGVPTPILRELWRELFPAAPLDSADAWRDVILELWRKARYREERYAALAVAGDRRYRQFRTFDAIPMLEEMIVSGAWWDYVDALATHPLGDVLRHERARRPARMRTLLTRWARGADLWKRRAAILCQISFKQETDLDLLYASIEPSLPTLARDADDVQRDFFIRKGIGWALRQYAWTDADEVRRYVLANRARLSPLSQREALKNIGGLPDASARAPRPARTSARRRRGSAKAPR